MAPVKSFRRNFWSIIKTDIFQIIFEELLLELKSNPSMGLEFSQIKLIDHDVIHFVRAHHEMTWLFRTRDVRIWNSAP